MTANKRIFYKIIPEKIDEFKMLPAMVVNSFLFVHSYWFTDSINSLYGRKSDTFKVLMDFCKTGKLPPDDDYSMHYVVNKFQADWLNEYFMKVE